MFQSPVYRFFAGTADESDGTSGFGYPEELADLSDATAVGDPIFQTNVSDGNGDSFAAGEYDGVDDGHNYASDSLLPTGSEPFTIAALCFVQSGTGTHRIANWGNGNSGNGTGDGVGLRLRDGSAEISCFNVGKISTGSNLEGEWITVAGTVDTNSDVTVYENGGNSATGSLNYNLSQSQESLGYNRRASTDHLDGYIAEVIISDVEESNSAISDYHTDRLG
jgi:hypothetical protein